MQKTRKKCRRAENFDICLLLIIIRYFDHYYRNFISVAETGDSAVSQPNIVIFLITSNSLRS